MTQCQITCKSLQKSSKCQNFLRVWHLVIFRADQLKKPPCISLVWGFGVDVRFFVTHSLTHKYQLCSLQGMTFDSWRSRVVGFTFLIWNKTVCTEVGGVLCSGVQCPVSLQNGTNWNDLPLLNSTDFVFRQELDFCWQNRLRRGFHTLNS